MKLILTARGYPASCSGNVTNVLRSKEWSGVLRYDIFRQCVTVTRTPPSILKDKLERNTDEWTDNDTTRFSHYLSAKYGIFVGNHIIEQAVDEFASKITFHPIQEYFDSLKWDGEGRIEKLFPYYFGSESNEYVKGIAKCWMISGVARTYQPGCQCDYMIVLEGKQGSGKTSGLRALVGPRWFSETALDLESKDAILALRGNLCVCFDELDSIRGKTRLERVKNFLTRKVDSVRLPYKRKTENLPRSTIFCGTTNEEAFLVDQTGNRRFLPVKTGEILVKEIERDYEQLWAEAVCLYKNGNSWHPDRELTQLCETEQKVHMFKHPWEEKIYAFLEKRDEFWAAKGGITTGIILEECLGKSIGSWVNSDTQVVGGILRSFGYLPYAKKGGKRYLKNPPNDYKLRGGKRGLRLVPNSQKGE